MRYRAEEGFRSWDVVDTQNPCREPIAFSIEEAEAKIIAFALNAIAEGGSLERFADEHGRVVAYHYDGPTEGVA